VVDLAALMTALASAGIEAAFPDVDFTELAVLDRGFGSIVLSVPHEVVVRVPRTETVAAAHRRERELLARIEHQLHVLVPKVSWIASPARELPLGASAYRWINGAQPLVPAAADAALVGDLASFVATLHQTPISLVAGVGLPDARDLARARVDDVSVIEPTLRARLSPPEFFLLQTRLGSILGDPVLRDFTPVLRHGDLWWGNVLVDEQSGGLNAVLDWEHAAIGDAAEDLATQRYLGEVAASVLTERYARLVGGLDASFRQRADVHFALREVSGIRRCIEMRDEEELDEELQKLRSGPLLS